MKSVLISIQPYWVFLIIAKIMGWEIEQHKTIEVRKNYPKDESWDKTAIIYCSKDKKSFNRIPKEYQPIMQRFLGKVIGEFVCDRIDRYYYTDLIGANSYDEGYVCGEGNTCLNAEELWEYGKGADLFGWHISDLKIYDKPKELSEFWTIKCTNCIKTITRPPQSWCYVGSLGE